MSARRIRKHLVRLGLPPKVIKGIWDDSEPCAFKGTAHRRKVFHLHYLKENHRKSKYASKDPMSVAYEASKHLHRTRSEIIKSGSSIPSPGLTKGKQNTKIGGPRRTTQHGPTPLSHEVDLSDTGLISEEDFEEMQCFYRDICNLEDEDADRVGTNDNTYIEPDDYDIEMAKAEADGLFNVSFEEQAEPSLEAPGLPNLDSVGKEETEGQRKRKQESVSAPEISPAALSGYVDLGEKRRKLEIGTNSSRLSAPRRRKKSAKEQGGKLQPHYLFSRSSSLAAVFQAALATGALDAPQDENSDDSELDTLDLELLGEEPSNSEHTQSSVSEDPKVAIAEALYQLVSLDDLHVAAAGANLLSSDISELKPADRDALKDAFGDSKELEPSAQAENSMPIDTLPRTVRFSDHYVINKSLMIKNGSKFKHYGTPTRASQAFQSLFEEQRLRKLVLDQGTAPTAGFGPEFVAKSLLDGRHSPLRKLVRDSQMSLRKRQKRDSRPNVKVLSRKEERKIAQIKKSGLSVKRAEPRAGEKIRVSRAEFKKLASKKKKKASRSGIPVPDPELELNNAITVGSLMPEVEEELAKWMREEEE